MWGEVSIQVSFSISKLSETIPSLLEEFHCHSSKPHQQEENRAVGLGPLYALLIKNTLTVGVSAEESSLLFSSSLGQGEEGKPLLLLLGGENGLRVTGFASSGGKEGPLCHCDFKWGAEPWCASHGRACVVVGLTLQIALVQPLCLDVYVTVVMPRNIWGTENWANGDIHLQVHR